MCFVLTSAAAGRKAKAEDPTLHVRKVQCDPSPSCSSVPFILDANFVEFHKIAFNNWPKQFPYSPDVEFRIAHTGTSILLQFRVREKDIRALRTHDNDDVWKDTCVEFFVSPDCNDNYYNIECNGTGHIWFAGGKYGSWRPNARLDVVSRIKRMSSLGEEPFDVREGDAAWTLVEVIPVEVFFNHSITSLDGMHMKGNFYKCGDELPHQHYMTWQPIDTPEPKMHSPQCFGDIIFD